MRTYLKRVYKKVKIIYAEKVNIRRELVLPNTYQRIYHFHIRKSAGTSINSAFWDLAGLSLKKNKRKALIVSKKLVFVRNSKFLIEKGDYFYANSHIPFWNLNLPKDTFMFCVFRDPYKRLVSLYKYYLWISKTEPKEAIKVEPFYINLYKQVGWLGNNFSDFIDNLPQKHLLNQLYMFSEAYDVEEAITNIHKLDRVYFQESFDLALTDLSKSLDVNLKSKKERKFEFNEMNITPEEKIQALSKLQPEYELFNLLNKKYITL